VAQEVEFPAQLTSRFHRSFEDTRTPIRGGGKGPHSTAGGVQELRWFGQGYSLPGHWTESGQPEGGGGTDRSRRHRPGCGGAISTGGWPHDRGEPDRGKTKPCVTGEIFDRRRGRFLTRNSRNSRPLPARLLADVRCMRRSCRQARSVIVLAIGRAVHWLFSPGSGYSRARGLSANQSRTPPDPAALGYVPVIPYGAGSRLADSRSRDPGSKGESTARPSGPVVHRRDVQIFKRNGTPTLARILRSSPSVASRLTPGAPGGPGSPLPRFPVRWAEDRTFRKWLSTQSSPDPAVVGANIPVRAALDSGRTFSGPRFLEPVWGVPRSLEAVFQIRPVICHSAEHQQF